MQWVILVTTSSAVVFMTVRFLLQSSKIKDLYLQSENLLDELKIYEKPFDMKFPIMRVACPDRNKNEDVEK